MFQKSSAKYYQKKNKERFRKKLVKGIRIFLKKRKTEKCNMATNDIKIS